MDKESSIFYYCYYSAIKPSDKALKLEYISSHFYLRILKISVQKPIWRKTSWWNVEAVPNFAQPL